MSYTPDLELRREVLEAHTGVPLHITHGIVYDPDGQPVVPQAPDISFDAILPLVRELSDDEPTKMWLKMRGFYNPYGAETGRTMSEWLIEEATPADYCRAYLAAKGEENA